MKKMKQMMAVILAGILIAGSLQISAGAAETVPLDPELIAEMPFDEAGLVEVQSEETGLIETQSEEELYADSQPDETDIAEAQTDEDDFAEVQTDKNNYPEETEQESAEAEIGFPVQEAAPEEESNDLEAVNADENSISDQEAEAGTEDQQEVIPSEEFEETSFPDSADSEITDASSENGAENLDGEKRFIENNPDEKTDAMPLDNGATNQEFQSVIEQDSDSGDDQNHENTDESISGTADNENNAVENFPENRTLPDLSESVSEETVADDEKFAGSNPYPTTQDVDGDGNYEVPCTRFAWQQAYDNHGISLPGWGNAVNWFQGAKNSGYSTGSVAQPGSIAVWSGDYYGHVAYVTSASGTTFTVNEGGRTDLDHTSSHGIAYGYRLTNATGGSRPYDSGKTLLGFIYLNGAPAAPTNPTISVNKTRFLASETITIKAHADGAIRYYGAIYKGKTRIWEGDCLEGGVIQYAASQFGSGQFSAYVSCTNYIGGIDTGWVGYTVIEDVGDNFCAFITTNWEKEWKFLGASDEGDVRLTNSDYRYHPRRIWRFRKQTDGSYIISNMYWDSAALKEGKRWVLSCEGQGSTNNTNVIVSGSNGSASQKWDIYYDPDNGYTFSPAHCPLVMDLTAGATAYGTNIQLYEPNYSSAQKFDIYRLSKDNVTYTRPQDPAASSYSGETEVDAGKEVTLTWTESAEVNSFDHRYYNLKIFDENGTQVYSQSGITKTNYPYTFGTPGKYYVQITAVNEYMKDVKTVGSKSLITVCKPDLPEEPVQITAQDVKLARTSYVYDGTAKKPKVTVTCNDETLTLKTDYTVSYRNNLNVGTATVTVTGKGNYEGTVKKTFKITAASIADASIIGLKTKTYTGKALVQAPVVELNDSELQEDVDYTVSYENNVKAGTATVTVTGIGNYKETASATFKINAASISKATVTCPASKVWAGWALTPVPTVKIGSKTLTKGTDFTLSYKNNRNVGTATVTITGKGNYTGTINRTFRINPKPTAISKVTPAKGKLTLTWKKQASQTSGYQIQFSSRSDFKTQKTVKVASAAATSRALTGLTRKHKYYVRIRTYKQIGSQYYYSTWSGAKSATTK